MIAAVLASLLLIMLATVKLSGMIIWASARLIISLLR